PRVPGRQQALPVRLCIFCQAEDGIRDRNVTGVQTCALPIPLLGEPAADGGGKAPIPPRESPRHFADRRDESVIVGYYTSRRKCQIGRASCREREELAVGAVSVDGQHERRVGVRRGGRRVRE